MDKSKAALTNAEGDVIFVLGLKAGRPVQGL